MYRLSCKELHESFLKGERSAEEIVTYFLGRIHKYDRQVGAFLSVCESRALEKARSLDLKRKEGRVLGRLAAIPFSLKDNIHLKGELSTCGSKFLTNYRAVFDATVTRLMEEEDAIVLGKTNLDEFGMGSSTENSALKKTCNPWDLNCVPGGSSGGSTAAVAARLTPLSFGSDTGGSVRQPAAFCNVTGFKPTYGRLSRYGLVAYGSSLDQIGPIAARTEDIGMVMEVLGRHDERDSTSSTRHSEDYLTTFQGSIKGKKIGVPYHFLEGIQQEVRDRFDEAIKELEQLGCEIVEIDLSILKYSLAVYYIIATAEASTNLARFDGIRYGMRSKRAATLDQIYDFSKSEGFGAEVKRRILLGTFVLSSGYQNAYYKQATKVRSKLMEECARAFQSCDVIATPTSPIAPFSFGAIHEPLQMYLQDIFTIAANLACLPAVSLPCGFVDERLPVGLQLMGPRHEDVLVMRLANAYEKKTRFSDKIPPLFDQA